MINEFTKIPLGLPTRAAGLTLLTWPPIFVLSLIERQELVDISSHARFLIAVPLLVLAELPISRRLNGIVRYFYEAGIVAEHEQDRFSESVAQAFRLNCSRLPDLVLLITTYLFIFIRWNSTAGFSWAGLYSTFVALPVFYFLILRWGFRITVWMRFLIQVSRLKLFLTPAHPDGAAGIGVLGKSAVPFGYLLFALSCVVSGGIATRILYAGAQLEDFIFNYAALIILGLMLFTLPLLVFLPKLIRIKQEGLTEYGILAGRYTQQFDIKWFAAQSHSSHSKDMLLGSSDIQSLADLASVCESLRKMRIVPIEAKDFAAIAILGMIPALPLAALVMPVSEILKGVLRLVV